MDRIKRCQTCHIGFPKLGRLKPEMRLENHANIPHESKCLECGGLFVSDAHVRYHLTIIAYTAILTAEEIAQKLTEEPWKQMNKAKLTR